MKRMLALALACLLLVSAAALAEETYPIETKFYRQAFVESAYRGTLTMEVTGERTAVLDDVTFAMLKMMAPRLSLSLEHSYVGYIGGAPEGQATVTLLLDGQSAGRTTLLYNQTLMGVSSDLMAGENTFYTAARDWNVQEALSAALRGGNEWPSMPELILAVSSAPQEWQERARPFMTPFETKLSIWLNGFAAVDTGVDEDGVNYTELRFKLPAAAIKAELKQLLVDLYGNAELLTLLREVASPRAAAAYLDPGMLDNYLAMIDKLQLEGEAEVLRRYDSHGQSLLDRVSFPFAENQGLRTLTVSVHRTSDGPEWRVIGETTRDTDFDITCLISEEMIYTGTVTVSVPAPERSAFVVSDEDEPDPERRTTAFDYNLIWEPGEEKINLETKKTERTYRASLLLKPKGEDAGPNQSLTLEAAFSSGSTQRSATRLDAFLEWRDLDSDAAVTIRLDSKTVSPFTVRSLNSVAGAVRVDLLDAQGWQALLSRWQTNAQTWLTGVLSRLAAGAAGIPAGRK